MVGGLIRALTGTRRIRPTSIGCRKLRQPNLGRTPLSHAKAAVQTTGTTSVQDRFGVLWTDTRTKVQELFFDTVETERTDIPEIFKGISAEILAGVMGDGGGWILVGGKVVKVPPRGPIWQAAQALVAFDSAEKIKGPAGAAIRQGVGQALMTIAGSMSKGKQR